MLEQTIKLYNKIINKETQDSEVGIIPVLVLDDDNHACHYLTRNGYWWDVDDFIREVLAKPHSYYFECRIIRLVDEYEDITEEMLDEMFEILDSDPQDMKPYSEYEKYFEEREMAFTILFDKGEKI